MAALVAACASIAGCCPPGIDGRWVFTNATATTTVTMVLETDGAATFSTVMASCTGALMYSGPRWTACEKLEFHGAVNCTGMIVCSDATFDCASTGTLPIASGERDNYSQSADGTSLTVQFASGTLTFHAGM